MYHSKEYSEFVTKVCELSDCRKSDIKTKSRKREVVRARQIIISYRHLVLGLTQKKSTSPFGMNHSSVPHIVKTVRNDYKVTNKYKETFDEIFKKYPILVK